MGIKRKYNGLFYSEGEYFDNLNTTLESELNEISNLVNNIVFEGAWVSVEAQKSVQMMNEIIRKVDKARTEKIEDAKKILKDIDTLLCEYE